MYISSQIMKKKFPEFILSKIEKAVNSVENPIAVFDADGTLWNTDIGECFFRYQIENNLLKNLPTNAWDYYRALKSKPDPRPAYLWLAQINKGIPLCDIKNWAKDCVAKHSPIPVFPEIEDLINFFMIKKVSIYVVTASVKWAVEPAALKLGIGEEQVLGVSTKIENGVITDKQEGIITYKQGKSDQLMLETNNLKPIFSCGNSMGDISLLEISAGVALAVQSALPGTELFDTESALKSAALTNGWLSYSYV